MYGVQERIYLIEVTFGETLYLLDSFVNQRSKFTPLISIFLRVQVELVQQNLADLDQLLVAELEILIGHRHTEVRIDEVVKSILSIIGHDRRQASMVVV